MLHFLRRSISLVILLALGIAWSGCVKRIVQYSIAHPKRFSYDWVFPNQGYFKITRNSEENCWQTQP